MRQGEDLSNWDSKMVWSNFHSCSISSTKWDIGGILVGNKDKKFNFSEMDNLFFHADPLPRSDDFDYDKDLPFGIYLLGHDDCADHQISIKKNKNGKFNIEWKGRIALAYSGEFEFNHEFYASIEDVVFEEVFYPKEMSKEEARKCLEKFSRNCQELKLTSDND